MVKVLVKMGRSFEPTLEESKVTHGSALELSLFKLQLEKHGHAVEFENSLDLPARTIRVLTRKSNGKSSRVVGESTHHLIKKSCEVDRIIEAIASTLVRKPVSGRRRNRRSRGVRAEKEPTEEARLQNALASETDEFLTLQHLRSLANTMDQLNLEGTLYLRKAADSLREATQQRAMAGSPLKEVVEQMACALDNQAQALEMVHQSACAALARNRSSQEAAPEDAFVTTKVAGRDIALSPVGYSVLASKGLLDSDDVDVSSRRSSLSQRPSSAPSAPAFCASFSAGRSQGGKSTKRSKSLRKRKALGSIKARPAWCSTTPCSTMGPNIGPVVWMGSKWG
mmetsp:Transcript_22850/g.38207  ORF Transcript_22850/g.38207 Transcript_22850/m.38207 type:complete len:339 (-) Transcript_22850:85-1101(-)|eukprot:CAMPEP_0198207322 /NCGR_PEP_ID=MMETSP1445-20131203/10779_1 /TAXON_ID=36898 /ORGANISM="Pyramimonas sp., Strain CCMP2087" /LENGTH=338 /DNA_ID=CAMNT_0043880305 /DNA_START=358 /DNA_END=1374 /DNA_ORIENTATION=+